MMIAGLGCLFSMVVIILYRILDITSSLSGRSTLEFLLILIIGLDYTVHYMHLFGELLAFRR